MSIGPVSWRSALVASSVTTSSARSVCSPSPPRGESLTDQFASVSEFGWIIGPSGPAFGADEREHIVTHLQTVAERADRRTPGGLLLARQAYYLLGFDTSPETMAWLARMYRTDRQAVKLVQGWSPGWPLARSTASALTRLGDPEPMRRFIADQLCDEAGERANLNYWAFWAGDFAEQQTSDTFIGSTPLSAWHGYRLVRHLLDRLYGNIGFLELNIHTLWSLIRIRPEMITGPQVDQEMAAKAERLL